MVKYLLSIIIFLGSITCNAQKWSVSTNAIDYMALGTINLEGSYAVSRHWSVEGEWKYNPWTFKKDTDEQFQNRVLSGSLAARWWPWHTYAGWWVRPSAQYEIYNRGGLIVDGAEEGTAIGVGIGFGYALLISRRFNLDFGFGIWGGVKDYTVFKCTRCGRIMDDGRSWFLLPDDLRLSLTFVF